MTQRSARSQRSGPAGPQEESLSAGSERLKVEVGSIPGDGPEIPVLTLRSARPGPVVGIGANMHGDECTGIGVVHRLLDYLPGRLLRGTIHLYPSLNPQGLEAVTRHIPGDNLDPNRAYPGSSTGSAAERMAARVWAELTGRRIQLYIDLHTDSPCAVPYAILDRAVQGVHRDALSRRCIELAEASGLTVLLEYPPDRYLRFNLHHSLPGALVNQHGVAALTLEVGPRRCLSPEAMEDGFRAVLGVLTASGHVSHPAPAHPSRKEGGPWRRESGPRTSRSGVLVPLVAAGAWFREGTVLAEVRSLSGDVRERLMARQDGFVVAWPELAHVTAGSTSATLGVRESG